ncbi:uncharacterized protein LOC130894639 [Diorhabda carinulata]|uniref:uncharacterized protein LOC130894639 n=1 Tax=Diorhabda carinulata TaxID=1163345 RepID=UPI0025A30BBF|nr:uncharacterized protein LOC130894639 [Diorhabda carinulata]
MAPSKRIKTYRRSNTSLVNNSVDAFNVLFAKNMTKRLLMKKKKFSVKDLPPRNKCESLLGNDSLQISTDDTFDKLLKKSKEKPKEVPTVNISCDIANAEIVANTTVNKSTRTTRANNSSLCSSSLLNTNENIDSVEQTHLRRLLQPSIEKIEESLEIESARLKPNFSLSYITVPKETNTSAETSHLGISATDFIKNLQQEVVTHCSTPIVSSKKKKNVNKAVSPIKITTLLKKTFQDINKWDSEFPLENQSDNSKNICFNSFLNGLKSDPQQSSICKNNIENSYIQDKLSNKSPRRQSFITLRRRKVLKSFKREKKSNNIKKNLTVSLESFSNFEIKNLSNHLLSDLKDSFWSHLSLVNLTSKRNMLNQTDWSNCKSNEKIDKETDLSTSRAVFYPKIDKELVVKVPKLTFGNTCDDFGNVNSFQVDFKKAARKTISVMENVSRLQTKEDIFEQFYTRNINQMDTNKIIFEQFFKRKHKSMPNEQYFNAQEKRADFTTYTKEKYNNLNKVKENTKCIEYYENLKVNMRKSHSTEDFENFYKNNLGLIENKEHSSDTEESNAGHKEYTTDVSKEKFEDTFERFYKTKLSISDPTTSCAKVKEKECIKDLKLNVTNMLISQLEDTFEKFYKNNINMQNDNSYPNQDEIMKKTRDLIVNLPKLSLLEDETFHEINNIRQSNRLGLNQEEIVKEPKDFKDISQVNAFDTNNEICSSNQKTIGNDLREAITNVSCSAEYVFKTRTKNCKSYKKYSSEDNGNTKCIEAKSNLIVNMPEKQLIVNLERNDFKDLLNVKECIPFVTEEDATKDVMVKTSETQQFEVFYKDNYGEFNVPNQVDSINTETKSLSINSYTINSDDECNIIESSIIETDVLKKKPKVRCKTKLKTLEKKFKNHDQKNEHINNSGRVTSTEKILHITAESMLGNNSQILGQDTSLENDTLLIKQEKNIEQYAGAKKSKLEKNNKLSNGVKRSVNSKTNSRDFPIKINADNIGDSENFVRPKSKKVKDLNQREKYSISRPMTRSLKKFQSQDIIMVDSSCDSIKLNESKGDKVISNSCYNKSNPLGINQKSKKIEKKVSNSKYFARLSEKIKDKPDILPTQGKSVEETQNLYTQCSPKEVSNISSSDSDCVFVKAYSNKYNLNDSVIRSPKSIIFKAGKHWRRSLSVFKRSSVFLGLSKEDSSGLVAGKAPRLTSQRITTRFSVRFVPIKPVQELQGEHHNTTILEDFALNSSYVPDQILEASLEDTFRCLSLNSNQKRVSVKSQLSVPVTAKEIVLRTCSQTEPIPFSQCFPESVLRNCQKIGEGVYGEVFLFKNPNGGTSVLKIIPVEGDQIVNGERQKKFEEVLSEIIITMQLSNLRNNKRNGIAAFTEVQKIQCVQGRYPEKLIDLWDLFDETRGSENDCPDIFGDDQLYIVFQMGYGGKDLESFVFNSAMQAYSMFKQVAIGLAIAEKELNFEHRDLHWGNVLISTVEANKIASFNLDNKTYHIPTMGVEIAIIDYTLSRIEHDGVVIFNDLGLDPDLFTAEGDYQFEIYRLMQQKNRNNWKEFEPFTNILWLDYILEKALVALRYRNTKTKRHKDYMRKLKNLKEDVLSYQNVNDFVVANLLDI